LNSLYNTLSKVWALANRFSMKIANICTPADLHTGHIKLFFDKGKKELEFKGRRVSGLEN